ncbi:helix-turn-helix domain-containing protein [Streptomyces sp. NPDC087420]|uniref:AlbA family DNA-binding domain-containing protein n=1 Tax=Streptomyces sp. NPDC087420 TaxID=3365785 RepID=UPI003837819B
MARSWTRLHEHLGHRPGPLTYDMVAAAVAEKLPESDDLDWKGELPTFLRKPGLWNEFAKDVAAMANTRGGLLIYGVSDEIELVGIDLSEVDEKQMRQALRNAIQPYVPGVDLVPLPAPDGGLDVLVVDVPPSESAPHFQYGWEQKDKDRATFNAPYRVKDDTFYLAEHQVARAYQDRFARQDAAGALLNAHLAHATDTVLHQPGQRCAWLVVAASPARPVPRMVPAPTQTEAQDTLVRAQATANRLHDEFSPSSVMSRVLNSGMHVGLRRWVASNFLVPDQRTSARRVMAELHHDGSVVLCVALGENTPQLGDLVPVDTWLLNAVITDAVAVCDAFRLSRTPDTSFDITATLATTAPDSEQPALAPIGYRYGRSSVVEDSRHPVRLLPASTELTPVADDETLKACVAELRNGLLNQFGLTVSLT